MVLLHVMLAASVVSYVEQSLAVVKDNRDTIMTGLR
jgi:hypothetical protein